MNTVRCNNCMWEGEEEDLLLIEKCGERIVAIELYGQITNYAPREGESDFHKGCPNCKTDSYLIDIPSISEQIDFREGFL